MLGSHITQLRKNSGMSQAQLARQLYVSASAVGMYEQGRRTPDLQTLITLSNIFHVSIDYLVTGKELTNPEQHMND